MSAQLRLRDDVFHRGAGLAYRLAAGFNFSLRSAQRQDIGPKRDAVDDVDDFDWCSRKSFLPGSSMRHV